MSWTGTGCSTAYESSGSPFTCEGAVFEGRLPPAPDEAPTELPPAP